jgi:uncharacterized protein (TIGR00661 family)
VRILYGVQGTGNGHLSRARAMARALARHPHIEVDWLFSGRLAEDYFDMDMFGDFRTCRGLSFVTRAGGVALAPTLGNLRPRQFLADLAQIDARSYDRVISDFEPLTAWAARRDGMNSIGIGHQYALVPGVPRSARNPIGSAVLAAYAPVTTKIGLHWHHFDCPIFPPIIDAGTTDAANTADSHEVLVYLPFENPSEMIRMLQRFPATRFIMFGPGLMHGEQLNVSTRASSRSEFMTALAQCTHIICNSGFELISEALTHGKHILTRPLAGQAEQQSNARALAQLGYANTVRTLDPGVIAGFLGHRHKPVRMRYPDVAAALADWIAGSDTSLEQLRQRLWRETRLINGTACTPPEDPARIVPDYCI